MKNDVAFEFPAMARRISTLLVCGFLLGGWTALPGAVVDKAAPAAPRDPVKVDDKPSRSSEAP
jgi:hypothetical protein